MLNEASQSLSPILEEGLTVLLLGMGVVFTFLVILVMAMIIMSAIVQKLNVIWPEKVAQAAAPKAAAGTLADEIVAAIAVAISKK